LNQLTVIVDYIRNDFHQNKVRAIAEIFGMVCGVTAAILLAVTTPDPRLVECYIFWLVGSSVLFLCSLSRGSTGLSLSYGMYFIIDIIGFVRTWI